MKSGKLLALVAFIVVTGLFGFGQTQPNLENGFKNYGSIHGSNIDTVALEAGNWMLHAPLFGDIAQRGDLTFQYLIYASSKNWQIHCIPNPVTGQTCYWTPGGTGVGFERSNVMSVHRTVDMYGSGTGSVTYEGYGYTLVTADAARISYTAFLVQKTRMVTQPYTSRWTRQATTWL